VHWPGKLVDDVVSFFSVTSEICVFLAADRRKDEDEEPTTTKKRKRDDSRERKSSSKKKKRWSSKNENDASTSKPMSALLCSSFRDLSLCCCRGWHSGRYCVTDRFRLRETTSFFYPSWTLLTRFSYSDEQLWFLNRLNVDTAMSWTARRSN